MDWNSDPEFLAMQRDFLQTFEERAQLLDDALRIGESRPKEALKNIQFVSHKLAGVAASYGFEELTVLGAELDSMVENFDLLDAKSLEQLISQIRPKVEFFSLQLRKFRP